ncbi:hypothetical protein BS47DRAFT_1391996 [Hydnum rufescens UP504]|uniref:Uncharacterized protein n=1 Tax=Hydnum rufescens UP504 TaxID=1448309 RepID=A0A9P6AZU2_9AGAM|nr:hypothetical protein BS47DRAFT_1391996 [Hydnum rufescens UP504]
MKQDIESHGMIAICIEVKDMDLAVFLVLNNNGSQANPSASNSGSGYGTALHAPNVVDLTPLEIAQAKHTLMLKT